MDQPIEVVFEAIPADFVGYADHIATTGEFYRAQMKQTRVLVTLVGPLVAATFVLFAEDPILRIALGVIALVSALLSWFTWPGRWRKQIHKQVEKQLAMENQAVLFGPKRYSIDAQGVRFSGMQAGGYVRWPAVMRISTDGSAAYLHVSQAQAHIIPRRAFASPEWFDHFVQMAEYYRAMAQ